VVVATAPTLYFDNRQSGDPAEPPGRGEIVTLGDVYRLDPPDGPHVLGLQANIWTEHVRTDARLEAMVFPRLAAVAESGWTAQTRRSWPDFVSRLPGLMAIYRALGLRPDESALAVRAVQAPGADGKSVTVTLANQAALGDIRYTIDGSPPSALSATYRAAITLPLPRRLRAGAFLRDERISPLLDLPLDQASVVRRASQDLKLCSDKLDLNLEGAGASSGERPVILIDILNPCWIYAGADLSEGRALLVGVGTVPFHYQLGDDLADIELRAPATAAGELVARMDRCDGEILAVLPLAGARPNAGVSELRALLPPRAGRHDICLTFTARRLDPMWAVSWAAVETAPPLRSASQ
jgi:hexosaminidase